MPMPTTRATLEQTLEFCNKVREAGGANPLDALMPGVPEDPDQCLIARNLNFSCRVMPLARQTHVFAPTEWMMVVEDEDVRQRIATSLDLELTVAYGDTGSSLDVSRREEFEAIVLPPEIGQVASDFDEVATNREYGDEEFEPYIDAMWREANPVDDEDYDEDEDEED
jgi:hypothetical protein